MRSFQTFGDHGKSVLFIPSILILLVVSSCSPVPNTLPPSAISPPQSDDQPIRPASCAADADCITAGCSGTICQSVSADPAITTCEWKEEYACYQDASCICVNKACQWGDQAGLDTCLSKHREALS
ncbi:eight-cysteine-cluster domain-containing protein [Candidatus Woesearchaeota archaeon]|nr:eight-cysteine-cluster domain-containing protein [Candidatus Woesearchaeota archaeon]